MKWAIQINFKLALCICIVWVSKFAGGEHRTKEASQKLSDLYCHRCDTMIDGERCQDLKDNATFYTKCSNEQRTCKVKRISMSASTEDITGKPKLWLLQRNCTKICEPGCIVIGERTKLHSCTTCCEHSFCNTGSGTRSFHLLKSSYQFIGVICCLVLTYVVTCIA